MLLIRFEDVRDFGFFIFAGGLITGSLMIILGADILIADLLALMLV